MPHPCLALTNICIYFSQNQIFFLTNTRLQLFVSHPLSPTKGECASPMSHKYLSRSHKYLSCFYKYLPCLNVIHFLKITKYFSKKYSLAYICLTSSIQPGESAPHPCLTNNFRALTNICLAKTKYNSHNHQIYFLKYQIYFSQISARKYLSHILYPTKGECASPMSHCLALTNICLAKN